MGEARRRKLLRAIGAEAFGGTGTGVYRVTRYDPDTVTRMLIAAMRGDDRTAPQAVARFIAQTAIPGQKPPVCMSCDAEVPIRPPPNLPAVAVVEPGREEAPLSGVIVMAICNACDAKQTTPAAFESAALKALQGGIMSDARTIRPSAPGHA